MFPSTGPRRFVEAVPRQRRKTRTSRWSCGTTSRAGLCGENSWMSCTYMFDLLGMSKANIAHLQGPLITSIDWIVATSMFHQVHVTNPTTTFSSADLGRLRSTKGHLFWRLPSACPAWRRPAHARAARTPSPICATILRRRRSPCWTASQTSTELDECWSWRA